MSRSRDRFVVVSHLFIWISFPVRVLGDLLRAQSSQNGRWSASIQSSYDDLPGAGLFLLDFNGLTVAIGLLTTVVIVYLLQLLLTLAKSKNVAFRLVSVVLCFLLLPLIIVTINSVESNLSWQFYTLAIGQLAFLAGLYCSLAGYVYTLWK